MANPITIPSIVATVPNRGDALVIHVDVTAPADTRVCLTIDGKPREDTRIVFFTGRQIGFSAVALLEPGEHVVSLDVSGGELDAAKLTVTVLRA